MNGVLQLAPLCLHGSVYICGRQVFQPQCQLISGMQVLLTEPHLGDDVAGVRSAIGVADRLGPHHNLPISPQNENIVKQLRVSRSGVHPVGLLPQLKADEGVGQQKAVFNAISQNKEAIVIFFGDSMRTQHSSSYSAVCPHAGIEVIKDNQLMRFRHRRQDSVRVSHLRESVEEEFVNYVPPDTEECYIRSKAVNLFPPVTAENDTRPVLCNESQYLPLASDPLFHDLYVSVNTSTAHVPTNVYDLSSEIRTVANWTRNLDEVFRFNLEQDPSLKWQYFCSSTGFFKFFPGAMWKVQLADLKLDFFDCRSTLWYVGAASYPMEMVIIIDKSGSMKGRRNTISNATLVELLNTLTENDFFNVIYFSEIIKYAEPTIQDRLIQATEPNKDRIIRSFANHAPNGTANFQAAWTAAFSLLNINDSFNSWNGISEQQLSIMDLNPSNFTRPQPSNLTIVDNGTLKEVPLEEIQMDAQSSVPLIQSVSDSVHPKPKDFYLSVSTAVYDRTINTTKEHKGILLGVVGVDVPIEDVRNVLRGWKTGPLSHFFCTNNNGFVQFHPHYRPMHGSQLKRYYDNVDIDEIEQPLDFVLDTNTALPFYNSTLRTMLIDRQNDSVLLEALENPEDFLWALPMEKKIFTAALAGTPFSCGVSMRWYRNTTRGYPIPKFDTNSIRRHWNIRGSSMKVLNPQLTNPAESCEVDTALPYGALLSPVKFCKFGRDLLHLFSSDPICALKQVLLDSKSRKENNCDEQHIAEIFVDAQATSSIYNHWKNLEGHSLVNMFGIQQVFSIHQPGLIRFYNYTQPTYANFLSEHEAGVEDSLYSSTVLRSSFYENYKMLVFSPPPRQVFRWFLEKDLPVPMTVTTVVSHPAAESVPLAVSGAQLTYQKVTELFHSIVNSCRGSGCLRCNDTGVHCYITTENGQIIVSTQGEKAVNQNLKELDCALMEALVGANIMQEREFYDFQAICIEAVIPEVNFGSRIFSPLNRIAQFLWHFFTEFLLLWAKTAFVHLQSSAVAQASIWRDLPQISGGLDDYSTLHPEEKQNPENAPYAYGSQSRDESDFNFANQLRQDRVDSDPMLPPAFYGEIEILITVQHNPEMYQLRQEACS
nr:unnamed protein product [Spirometra erinaceieuropaei]